MVFYRKYRPQKIDDLDSAAVRDKLSSVLKKDAPHAFLFTGPKGLGKTSTARIVAKVVNCTGKKKGELEPCNACDQCLSINNNTNVDILEIDAASNRGIDEIRDLKEKIRLAPVSSTKKVYIIDEVHMLTTEAFNALLKTLEEPPAHAMFILCTTEPQKVPSTILSRCFHIGFTLATNEELVRSFKRIVAGENALVDDDALQMIARLADGGFRDGAKILEEVVTLSDGKPVNKAFIEEKYQVTSIANAVVGMIEAFAKRDTKKGLEIIAQLGTQGVEMKYFLQKVMETLHRDLLGQIAGQKAANGLSVEEIRVLFELLSKAYSEIKSSVLPQLPLELAIVDWSGFEKQDIEQASTAPSGGGVVVEEEVTVTSLRKQVGTMKRLQVLYGDKKKETKPADESVIETTTVELMHTPGDGEVTKEWLDLFWKNLLNEIKKHNHTVAGVLRGCTIKSYSANHMIISTAYKFHKERLDEMKNREALIQICKLLTGNDMEIEVELRKTN